MDKVAKNRKRESEIRKTEAEEKKKLEGSREIVTEATGIY